MGSLRLGDAGQMEDWIFVGQRIESGVVAEGALGAQLVKLYKTLEDDLGAGRNLEIHGFTFHQLDRRLPQEAGNHVLLDVWWRGTMAENVRAGSGPDGDGKHPSFQPAAGHPPRLSLR